MGACLLACGCCAVQLWGPQVYAWFQGSGCLPNLSQRLCSSHGQPTAVTIYAVTHHSLLTSPSKSEPPPLCPWTDAVLLWLILGVA